MSFTAASHPDHATERAAASQATATTADLTAELQILTTQIRAWQVGRSPRLSDEQMVRQFPGLGSTKTYRRMRDGDHGATGDTGSLIIGNHLPRYQAVWLQICERSGAAAREEIYADLTPAFDACSTAALLIPQQGRERLMLIEGVTGSGKSCALEAIASRYTGSYALMEAKTSWSSVNCMVCDWLIALDVFSDPHINPESKMPSYYGQRLAALEAHLKTRRKVILIDEGHHLCAEGLNVIKSILNATDSVIIIACIPTLWSKLAARAWAEAAQLIYNRLFERVRLTPPASEDVEMFLSRRVPALAECPDWKSMSGRVAEAAQHYGSYAFLRRLGNRLNQITEITPAVINRELEALVVNLRTRQPKAA